MRKEIFLLEIGTEEIPARFMEPVLSQLRENASTELAAARLTHGEIRALGSPRRLALLVTDLTDHQQDLLEKKKGPAVRAAFDGAGQPTPAAQGFARAQGVPVEALLIETIDGVEYVFAEKQEQGKPASAILPALCERLVRSLSFPKPMFWYSKDIRFARPVRWLTALYGSEVVKFTFAGLTSGRETYGHRFLAPDAIPLAAAGDYLVEMCKNAVVADPAERRRMISEQVNEAAAGLGGASILEDDLLEEVTYLVEYPKAVVGSFEAEYLEIPPEVLITAMRAHQRYFPVFDVKGSLMPNFIAISNGTADQFLGNVRAGNERVLRARLADARFFFEEDRKTPLNGYVERLESIVFMEQLGSMREKTDRLAAIIKALSAELSVPDDISEAASRAALLSKADLMTHMVYEFPELQGTMGRYYALLSGESEAVAAAIAEHYAPRYAGDEPPASVPGALVAIADKLDTLVACFGLGLIPSGSQDPYALRRSALGIVSILQAHGLKVSLRNLISIGLAPLSGKLSRPAEEVSAEVYEFLRQRVRFLFAEKGFRYDVIDAVLGGEADDLPGLLARALVLQSKLDSPELNSILTPFTRTANLTREPKAQPVRPELFASEAEQALYSAARRAAEIIGESVANRDLNAVFAALTPLQPYIDAFFNDVMVMVDDENVRNNRLSLLYDVKSVFLVIGDLSKIVQEKK